LPATSAKGGKTKKKLQVVNLKKKFTGDNAKLAYFARGKSLLTFI
jgi:hypothetical protein